jgi:peptide/nickel transport system substrate-binding protein
MRSTKIGKARRLTGLVAVGLAGSLALAACSDDSGGNGGSADLGLDNCDQNPNECNSGDRAEGGEIIWMINQGHDGVFNDQRVEGNSVYLVQMLEGITENIGFFTPDSVWTWNLDVLTEPAELVSEDPMTVVYRVNPDAVWSDNEPLDVDDAVWTWYHNSGNEEHCVGCNPATTSLFESIAGIEGSDGGKTITITYEEGFANPEWYALQIFTYPAHVAQAQGFDWSNDPEAMGESSEYFLETVPDYSFGPYMVENWIADERQELVPNPNWYGEIQPTLERLIKVVISDQPSWVPAMENEEIHGGSPASFTPDGYERMSQVPGTYVATGSAGAVWEHVDVNMDVLSDVALRQAIFTAIDIEDARTRIFGQLEPPYRTNHIFPQSNPFHQDHLSATGYGTGSADDARAILEAAGYTGAEAGGTLTDPEGEPVPDVRFAFLQGNENRATFTELAISYLGELGITVVPSPIPADQLGTVLGSADYDLVIFGWSGTPLFANAPNQFYHSTSGSNFGGLNNPQIDELAEQIMSQIEVEQSAALVDQLVPLVLEEAYVLPLWDTLNFMFVSDQYTNIRDNHNSSLRSLYNSEEWGRLASAN